MKKLIGTVAVAALLATAAFAEGISFGSWGRALWIVGQVKQDASDNAITSWLGQSWGGSSPRTALGVSGSSDNMGFKLDIHANGASLGVGDNALIWTKPVDMLRIVFAANHDENVLRSDACFGLWNFYRIGSVSTAGGSEGIIFADYLDRKVSLELTPIEGLTIGYGFDVAVGDVTPSADSDKFVDQIGRTSAAAVAYAIPNIGTIKVGFQAKGKGYDKEGGFNADRKDMFEIGAAFEFTMLEKVYIAVGGKIPLGGTFAQYNTDMFNDGKVRVANANPILVNLYARLNLIEGLGIHVLGGVKLNNCDKKSAADFKASGALGFRAGAEVDYSFSNGVGVFGQVEYANGIWMADSSADNKDCLTFGLGVTKGFSNGVIGIAFEGTTNGYGLYGGKATAKEDDLAWYVPLKLEYWF